MTTKKPIILIVDDEPDSLLYLRTVLEKEGYIINEASSGEEALKMTQQKPDLILMDIRMPQMDGFQVCEQLKLDIEYHNIPIILFSALLTDQQIKQGAIQAKADAFLKKPFELKALTETIKQKLGL
ncbi:MAG: response regulator [Candidatus Hermodarchaeota archaeon]